LKNNESNKNNIEKNSVYGELKLSDKLSDELQKVRKQVEYLKESLEESIQI
jgi:hypothetical protein